VSVEIDVLSCSVVVEMVVGVVCWSWSAELFSGCLVPGCWSVGTSEDMVLREVTCKLNVE
jgi:hypothetical protein